MDRAKISSSRLLCKCSGNFSTDPHCRLSATSVQQWPYMESVENYTRTLSTQEIVETFPEGAKVVKRLLRECQEFMDRANETRNTIRGNLSAKVSMFDIDIATELVMAAHFGNAIEKTKENMARLQRMSFCIRTTEKEHDWSHRPRNRKSP